MTIPEGPDRALAELAELHRIGALTDDEYRDARATVSGQLSASPGGGPTRQIAPPPGHLPETQDPHIQKPYGPAPGEQPGPGHRNTWLIVAGIAVAALAVAAVALILVLQRRTPSAAPAVDTSEVQPNTPGQTTTTPSDTGAFATSGPTPSPTLDPTTPAPTTTAPPTTVGSVDIGAVASDPQAIVVGQTLDTYFSGINQRNFSQTLSVLDPAVVNPANPSQVTKFEQGLSTSTDSNVTVTAIHTNPNAPSGIAADVTLQSTQASDLGPDGEACTNWTLTYQFSGSLDSGLRIYKTHGTHTAC